MTEKTRPSPSSPWIATVVAIVSWYGSNTGLLILNKFLLSSVSPPFKNPIFLTMCHLAGSAVFGGALALSGATPAKPMTSSRQAAKVFFLAAIFCLSVVMGNVSLKYIPVSFNQAVGATTPVATAILAYVVQGKKETLMTYLTMIPIVGGVVLASRVEPLFHALGFTACLLATAMRALKSVVQAILMTDPSEKLDPMSLLLYMSLMSLVMLLPATIVMEPQVTALDCTRNKTCARRAATEPRRRGARYMPCTGCACVLACCQAHRMCNSSSSVIRSRRRTSDQTGMPAVCQAATTATPASILFSVRHSSFTSASLRRSPFAR